MIRPFADALAEHAGLRTKARIQLATRLEDAFDNWLGRIVNYRSPAIHRVFKELRQHARPLLDRLTEVDSVYRSAGSVLDKDPHWAIGHWLNEALMSSKPHVDLGFVLTVLSVILHLAEDDWVDESDPKRQRGRPKGFDEYPGLDLLIFRLEFDWLASVGRPLPVYKKESEEAQIAAGSLIQVLDALRTHIEGAGCKWLADYLPPSDVHLSHVATYNRILERARKFAVADDSRARAAALEEGMKPFRRDPSTG